jgi:hypothetical protein
MNTSGIIAWFYKSFPSLVTRNSIRLSLHSNFLHPGYASFTLYLYKFLCFWFPLKLSLHLHVMSYTLHFVVYFALMRGSGVLCRRFSCKFCLKPAYFTDVSLCKTAVFVRAHKARVPVAKSLRCTGTWRTLLFSLDMSPNPFYHYWHPRLTKYHVTSFSRSFGSHFFLFNSGKTPLPCTKYVVELSLWVAKKNSNFNITFVYLLKIRLPEGPWAFFLRTY